MCQEQTPKHVVESENRQVAAVTFSLTPAEETAPKEEESLEKAPVPVAVVAEEKVSPPSPKPTTLAEKFADLDDEKKPADHKDDEKKPADHKDDHKKPAADYKEERKMSNSYDRDTALAKVQVNKRWALIKAWEESEKTKADNKAYKKLTAIGAWENCKRASVEAEIKHIEEKIERMKAEYAEKMKNKMAQIHREAEEKRAMVEASRGEDVLKAEETAAKFRATGRLPKRLFTCFSY